MSFLDSLAILLLFPVMTIFSKVPQHLTVEKHNRATYKKQKKKTLRKKKRKKKKRMGEYFWVSGQA